MWIFKERKNAMPSAADALPGRDLPIETASRHHVSGRSLHPPFAAPLETVLFGMGCFWGGGAPVLDA